MLFLPTDNSITHGGQQRRRTTKMARANLANVKATLLRNEKIKGDEQKSSSYGLKSMLTSSKSQKPSKAVKDIRKGSKEARNLISYMRDVQSSLNQTTLESDSYGLNQIQSPSREMTTMRPSTKERLRKNLGTFSRENASSVFRQKSPSMPIAPPNIMMKLLLPSHTSNAYHERTSAMRRGSSNASVPLHQKPSTAYDGGILPYTKNKNDETYLYKLNASKPLYSELREANNLAKTRSRMHSAMRPSRQTNLQDPNFLTSMTPDQSSVFKHNGRNSSQSHVVSMSKSHKRALLAKQKLSGNLLSQGMSRHFSVKRNSHEECKLIASQSQEDCRWPSDKRMKFIDGSDYTPPPPRAISPSSLKYSEYPSTEVTQRVLEEPFIVKLCIKCQRSVKFRKGGSPSSKAKSSSKKAAQEEILIFNQHSDLLDREIQTMQEEIQEKEVVRKAESCTQVESDLGVRYRNQRFTQTQKSAALDAYTQSEALARADQGTTMSQTNFGRSLEDREVQTIKQQVKRPSTSNQQRRQRKRRKTYNLMQSEAQDAELVNGRKFVIYNKDEYSTFIDSKRKASSSIFDKDFEVGLSREVGGIKMQAGANRYK